MLRDEPRSVPVLPPRLSSSPDVPYPDGARGEATVVLALTVGEDGRVEDVRVDAGDEPFGEAAVAAARSWRFEPARQGGRAVAARIRFEVQFRPPAPAPPVQPPEPHPRAEPPPPKEPGVEEVRVTGVRVPPGATSLGRAEVRQLPGAFGDPFRALDALPGVTPIISGLPFFYVRGAPPGNIGYFLDGVRVPYLFHVGFGPSVVHPGMVDSVQLHPGGYPARYGRFAGGIVAAQTTEPRAEFHGEANIRLFDAGALAESGFADGKGTALVGGRYSYTAALVSLFAPNTRLDYRDFQGRVSYDVTPQDRLTLFTFGAYDLVAQTVNGIESVLFGSEFYRADLRWDHRFGPDTTVRVATTVGFDQNRIPGQPRNSQDTMGATRVVLSHRLSDVALLSAGADAMLEAFRADIQPYADPDDPTAKRFNALFPARDDVTTGAWVDVALKLGIWELVPGFRMDLYRSSGASAVGIDPRIASRIEVAKRVHVIHALGIAHQPPSFLIPVPGLAIGQLKGGLQESYQASGGVEVEVPELFTATVTGFDNVFRNMSDTLGVSRDPTDLNYQDPRSLGSAVGLEVYLRRKLTRHIGGYLSYTLSRSTRSVGTEHFLSTFDRPHVANAALAYDLGRNWRAGTRFTIYSGTPLIPPGGNGLIAPPRSLSPERDPTFYRLDLRLEKRWYLTRPKGSWIAFVAEMMNVTLHKETLQGQAIGPVSIPSLGVEAAL
jgi:TonB family protein